MVDSVLTLKFLISLVFVGAILAVSIKFLLSKSRFGPISFALVLLVGGYFLYDQMIYTTSDATVIKEFHEDSEIRNLQIRKVEFEIGTYSFKERMLIEDEETIRKILQDLSDIELKREINKEPGGADYVLDLLISNLKNDMVETGTIQIIVGKEYINDYKIVSDKDHLKTLKELDERNDLEWETE